MNLSAYLVWQVAHSNILKIKTLQLVNIYIRGPQALGPQTVSGSWPIRNWTTQLEVSGVGGK